MKQRNVFLRATTVLVAAIIAVCGSMPPQADAFSFMFTKLAGSDVNKMEAEKAVEIVNGLYAKWGQDIFDPVSDEFDSKMQQGLTPDLQRRAFYDVKRMFGDYSGMTFYEALTQRFFGGTVYRFKGSFSQGAGNQPEIRVVFDKQGKISGLWIKPWAEEMR